MPDDDPAHPRIEPTRTAPPVAADRAWVDYSHEIRMQRNPLVRIVFLVLGWLCVVSGAIGVVVPGWPTTIWIILAAYFFGRSSPRFYNWTMNHRLFGPLIRDWREGNGMSARAKTMAVSTILITISISVALIPVAWVKALLVVIAVTLCTYLLRLPTKRPATAEA
ncbi:MAG: YbaN family protein [bacterium]|nr:YbaN family protein [bacterium]